MFFNLERSEGLKTLNLDRKQTRKIKNTGKSGSCIYKFIQLQPKTILVVRFYSIKILNLLFLVAISSFYFTT